MAEDIVELAIEALEIIAGERQCLDNLMSNEDVAREALSRLRAKGTGEAVAWAWEGRASDGRGKGHGQNPACRCACAIVTRIGLARGLDHPRCRHLRHQLHEQRFGMVSP